MTTQAQNGAAGATLAGLAAEAARTAEGARNTGAGSSEFHVDAAPVNAEEQRSLYAERVKVYPKLVHGTFRRIKWAVMLVTLSIYYFTPWIRWDRGPAAPDQAVLLDFPNRRFYFFFIEIWPQEVYYITGLLIIAAFALFLVTSVAGRVWCGYTCPQTVWTDLFVHVERWVEGDRNARIRLDKSPLSIGKVTRKVTKHAIWLAISVATGGAWVFYFADAPTLASQLLTFDAPSTTYFFIALFTATTYLLGGIAREQVCTYMCPWPRIQGAMFDEESLLVSYREDRGEPRGPHKKNTSWEGRGDCIDCNQCVAACPMGIDIRDGMQLECIQCALCIDACNEIMDKVGRPRNLISYDTFSNQERRQKGEREHLNLIRPRTIIYSTLIILVSAVMLFTLLNRSTLDINVLRDRNPIYVTLSDGSVRNGYAVKILNKEHAEQIFDVRIEGIEGAVLSRSSIAGEDASTVVVGPDTLRNVKYFVVVPADRIGAGDLSDGSADLTFVIENLETGDVVRNPTTFQAPSN